MLTQNVLKTDSLEFVINGKFVFCKELKKGFIKGDLSTLGLTEYSFETVASMIEGLSLIELKDKGLNTVIFVNGEEKISQKMNLEIEKLISEMVSPTVEIIALLQSDNRITRDYFDESIIQDIIDNLAVSNTIALSGIGDGWTVVAKHSDGAVIQVTSGEIDINADSSVMDDARWLTLRNNMTYGMAFKDENGKISFISKSKLMNANGSALSTTLQTTYSNNYSTAFIMHDEDSSPIKDFTGLDYTYIALSSGGNAILRSSICQGSSMKFDIWPYTADNSYLEHNSLIYYIK